MVRETEELPAEQVRGKQPPKLNELFRHAEQIWLERSDLQQAFRSVRDPEFWYWLMWHGADDYPWVAQTFFSIPNSDLRSRVAGNGVSSRDFRLGGLVNWRRIDRCLREAGFDFGPSKRVLDFGCGCGRILRYFSLYSDKCSFFGSDVDQEAVEWCGGHLEFAEFAVQDHAPPTPFEDELFDAIYAYSVFSHLPEDRHRAWLEDLHRISRSGAVLVLTVQGQHILNLIQAGDRDLGCPTRDEVIDHWDGIQQSGFAFYPYLNGLEEVPTLNTAFQEWDMSLYGNTFILENYIRRFWGRHFEVHTVQAAPDSWQDYVVLRKI